MPPLLAASCRTRSRSWHDFLPQRKHAELARPSLEIQTIQIWHSLCETLNVAPLNLRARVLHPHELREHEILRRHDPDRPIAEPSAASSPNFLEPLCCV